MGRRPGIPSRIVRPADPAKVRQRPRPRRDDAGVERPEKMQGHTCLGPDAVENEYVFASRDRCDATVMRIRTVRDDRYRYIRNFMPEVPFTAPNLYKETMYPVLGLMKELHATGELTPPQTALMAPGRPSEELYNLETDPWEIHNLADSTDPEHQRVKEEMAAALEHWMDETGDHERPLEPEALVEEIRKRDEAFWAKWTPPS